jgi:hypothetical protein
LKFLGYTWSVFSERDRLTIDADTLIAITIGFVIGCAILQAAVLFFLPGARKASPFRRLVNRYRQPVKNELRRFIHGAGWKW